MSFVYILKCADGSYYSGYTTDLKRRLQEHNDGIGSKYTIVRRPVCLVYFEKKQSKQEAMKREHEIKMMKRIQKEKLIENIKLKDF